MAVWYYDRALEKNVCAMHGHKAGDTVQMSMSSYAYSQPQGGFGFRGSQWTSFVLPEPICKDQFGADVYDLNGLGQCPIDGSFQTEEVKRAAERREWDRTRLRSCA